MSWWIYISLHRHAAASLVCKAHDKTSVLQVDAYEQGRPGYPREAVHYALKQLNLDSGNKKILDLAAGTGKLTRCALPSHCPMKH